MKFLADMGISPKTVAFLGAQGHQAEHLVESGLEKLSDSEILEKANAEDLILLTHDLDFAELMAASQAKLPSVVVFRLRNMKPENVNAHLTELLDHQRGHLERGAVVSITESHIRVRELPISRK